MSYLVPRKRIEINPELLDVDLAVGRVGDGVNADERIGVPAVHLLGDGLDVVDGAEDVAGVGAGDQSGPVTEQAVEV